MRRFSTCDAAHVAVGAAVALRRQAGKHTPSRRFTRGLGTDHTFGATFACFYTESFTADTAHPARTRLTALLTQKKPDSQCESGSGLNLKPCFQTGSHWLCLTAVSS